MSPELDLADEFLRLRRAGKLTEAEVDRLLDLAIKALAVPRGEAGQLRASLSRSDDGAWEDICRLKAEKLTDPEIAEALGTSAGAIRSMRYRRRHGMKRS